MARFLQNRTKLKGKAPGEMVFVGHQRMAEVEMQTITYNADLYAESIVESVKDFGSNLNSQNINWLNIHGLHSYNFV